MTTRNLLRNMLFRDVVPVCESFDAILGKDIAGIDELFSNAAFIMFASEKIEDGIDDKYKGVLLGLVNNCLNTLFASVLLMRNGLYKQAMAMVRQVIEIAATIFHIVGDPDDRAIDKFISGDYHSTKSLAQAKKAVPIIAEFWGFLSQSYVHVNRMNSTPQGVVPYAKGDPTVKDFMTCLRMASWIAYLAAEIAFPMTLEKNRYWKLSWHNNRNAVAYNPDEDEREWAANFLGIESVTASDLSPTRADDEV